MGKFQDYWIRFKTFIKECIRVFKVTKKPSMDEFKAIIKVTSIGIAIIGFIGFVIQMLWQMIRLYS